MADNRIGKLRWRAQARRHPSAFLLGAQLLSLVLYPLFDEMRGGRVLFGALGVAVLMLAVWVVNRSPAKVWVAWLLAAPALLLSVAAVVLGNDTLLVVSSALEALLYLYAAASLIAYMLGDHRVTTDELFAAGATFTLLAWGFAYAYFVCQAWYPGSFTGAVNPEAPRTWLELLFLSFTTLSATGLGDILPLSSPARVLVMLEQFAGVAYIAVVVSRLVGLTILRYGAR
ncbi:MULTISPECIES: potassium channel family protein [unclassified Lysobacter]|uniref:potassium channel family protein n=1 Tax=unclassified Lysobacter TaxID=2635362 RepID=UPI001C229CA2|nr:potassium channel family protein [Lysobacter sp. MMG2]MBU8977723.1 potassium channel family protein [Lysobacter sp. MMG2]